MAPITRRTTMPATLSVEEAQSRLKELIDKLAPGEEIVLTDNQQPVARLVGGHPARPPRPAPGLGKGSVLYIAPDFDEPPEEFKQEPTDVTGTREGSGR